MTRARFYKPTLKERLTRQVTFAGFGIPAWCDITLTLAFVLVVGGDVVADGHVGGFTRWFAVPITLFLYAARSIEETWHGVR